MNSKKMKCKTCNKVIKITNPKTRNIKFCSVTCRNKSYQSRVSAWQRNKFDKLNSKPAKNKIQCLICGRWYKQVGTHIVQRHEVLAKEYRKEYGFDVKRGQLPPDLRELKAMQVFANGTVKNLKKGKKFWFKKGDEKAGKYIRSPQTLERLKVLHTLK